MATTKLSQLWKRQIFKTAAALLLVAAILGVSYLTLSFALGTTQPVRWVSGGDMCVAGEDCDGLDSVFHPFSRTLHKGDLLLVQSVPPEELNCNYPNSDIIVYSNPKTVAPIIHRIVEKQEVNGTLYFTTKMDANDKNDVPPELYGVPADSVEGRVVFRVPLLGWIPLLMQTTEWGIPAVTLLIILLAAFAVIFPAFKRKRVAQQKKTAVNPTDVFIKSAYDKSIIRPNKGDKGCLKSKHQ